MNAVSEKTSRFAVRRPLLGIALVFMLGIWCGVIISTSLLIPFFCSLIFLVATVFAGRGIDEFSHRNSGARNFRIIFPNVCVHLSLFFVAWFAVGLRIDNPSERELSALMKQASEGVEVTGVVVDDPAFMKSVYGGSDTCVFMLRVDGVSRIVPWQKARGLVRVYMRMDAKNRLPRYGDRLLIAGALRDRSSHGGNFRRMPFRYTLSAASSESFVIERDAGIFIRKWCFELRRRAAQNLEIGIADKPDVVGLLQALLLGYRENLDEDIQRDFRLTGTYHILAISGLHVAILSLFIIALLGAFGVSRVHWVLFLAPCLLFFAVATGMRPSTVRGSIMAATLFLGPFMRRKTDIASVMAFSAIVILACSPLQLFDRGFILSFTVIAGLMVICPRFIVMIERFVDIDPARLQLEPFYINKTRRFIRLVMTVLAISLAAWLTAFPLIAAWFNLITPIAPLSNLLLTPLTPLILLSGWFSILFGAWLPFVAETFNFANVALVGFMIGYIHFLTKTPLSGFFVESPPLWFIITWYGCLLAWTIDKRKIFFVAVAILFVFAGFRVYSWVNIVNIEILNIGGHAVCLIDGTRDENLLLNTASRFHSRELVRQLRKRGINRLRALVLTRADAGAAGGAVEILRVMPVDELWCSSTNMLSPVFINAIDTARKADVKIVELARGHSGELRGGVQWTVLHPHASKRYRSADEGELTLLFRRSEAFLIFGKMVSGETSGVETSGVETSGVETSGGRVLCLPRDYPEIRFHDDMNLRAPASGDDLLLRPGENARIQFHGDSRWLVPSVLSK